MRGGFLFCTVRVVEKKRGILSFLKYYLKKPEPILNRIDIESGKYFYYLEIDRRLCSENFSEIYRLLGRISENIIPCNNFNIFSSGLLKRFDSTPYKDILLLNSSSEYIKNDIFSKNKSLLIYDLDGRTSLYCDEFVPIVKRITVATSCPFRYENIRNRLFEEYGASLVIIDRLPNIKSFDYAIFVSHYTNAFPFNSFAVKNNGENCFEVYKGSGVSPDKRYIDLCPQGADLNDFTAALYLLCKIKELGKEKYTDFNIVSEIRF